MAFVEVRSEYLLWSCARIYILRCYTLLKKFLALHGCHGSSVCSQPRCSGERIDCRTLFVSAAELERSIRLVGDYRRGKIPEMNEELWRAKKGTNKTQLH